MSANERQVGGSHYGPGRRLQHWDLAVEFKWDYLQAQIIKYLMRWRDKNGVEDLEKAAHYLEKYIETERSGERALHPRMLENPQVPLRVEAQFVLHGEVIPTGWSGFTFEGADGSGFSFRCKACLERFYTEPDGNPHRAHQCPAEPVSRGYVNQDAPTGATGTTP